MNASDIMTTPVITVQPDTALVEVVQILLTHRISGVFVVADGAVIGVVGDGDLLHRHEIGTDERAQYQTWWQRLSGGDSTPDDYVKAFGGRAKDVMDNRVVSVTEDTSLPEVAAIFEARHVRRIPVLKDGTLRGLITRADLVRAFANSVGLAPPTIHNFDDKTIKDELLAELSARKWWSGNWSNVFVNDGVVTYVGVAHSAADREAARIAAENIPGVKAVDDRRMQYGEWMPMY